MDNELAVQAIARFIFTKLSERKMVTDDQSKSIKIRSLYTVMVAKDSHLRENSISIL